MSIASKAVENGLEVALVDKDPIGGTCLNRGCVPSKTMIFPADVIQQAKEAEKLGLNFSQPDIDFQKIMKRTRESFLPTREEIKKSVENTENLTFFDDRGKFVDDYKMEVSGETVEADKVFLFSGSRPSIPPIEGIDDIDYLTNRNIFDIDEKPESLIIIGGGYIGVEFAHFFSAVGTEVKLVELTDGLLPGMDRKITNLLEKKLSDRIKILTNNKVIEVGEESGLKFAISEDMETGQKTKLKGESLLVAVGRESTADLLEVENTGVETDEKGWIKVDEKLETSKKDIWAGGDAIGKHMFRHIANYEASVAKHNAFGDHDIEVDYHAVPYAVFTHPQIGGVGMNTEEAKKDHDILVTEGEYKNTARGYAMGNVDGFCKIIVDRRDGKILGAHIIGPHASVIIHEIVNLMYAGDRSIDPLYDSIHIHPSLSEVVTWSLGNWKEV